MQIMTRGSREIWIGVLVLALGMGIGGYFYGGLGSVRADKLGTGYTVVAHFNRSDGLATGGEVRLAGVSVGRILSQRLGSDYQVWTTLHIVAGVHIPDDSAAVIHSDGLLGPKFIELVPGGSHRMIPPGSVIRYTQDAIVIDDLLERILARARVEAGGPGRGEE
ncbi:ABC-type transport system involved in resistance to organic solvents, periplasmic component [invertebrate metagenome]|uniref:ABC-type transport system involved in resistance to organic solvents, periplasmic component n=1 Tax=invertebrate metagenome TaxID=1711999 RepID=A0A484H7G5_9ZZZZ